MSTTELFRKHFGENSAVVDLKHPNIEAFFEDLNQECLEEDKCKHEFICRVYPSPLYGTCIDCGETILNN